MRRRRRIAIYVLAGIFVVAALFRISLPYLVPRIANPILSRQLGAAVVMDGVQLQLLRGRARIQSITIAQPNGFAPEFPLLRITRPTLAWQWRDLLKQHIHIPAFEIATLEMHVIRKADGTLNLQQLQPPSDPEKAPEPVAPRENTTTLTLAGFHLRDALLSFTDLSVVPPIALTITNLQMEAQALRFDPPAAVGSTSLPGHLQMTGTLLQPGFADGYLGARAAIGIASTNIPAVNAAARIVGFDLQTLQGLLPPGIASFLGGSNLDVAVDAAVAPEYLRVQNRVLTAGNTWRLAIGGTPDKIEIDRSTALFNLVTRPAALLTGAVEGVADAGVSAGRTVIATAGRASGGILKGVANIGRGAAGTVQSAARGDIRGMGDGVKDMTFGTVTGAVDSVTSTVRGVGEGLGETISAATGRTKSRNWNNDNAQRWDHAWEDARNFVSQAPYPGTAAVPRLEMVPPDSSEAAPEDPPPSDTAAPDGNPDTGSSSIAK